ncbi:hypothetical protein [Verrucomicrobium spinosum]|uniref:hypothetical protein n=1 Tax=Verrucomicrobium spinosum TaxID=2736 RepID=UPI000174668C|nr:hypothetical protein [Verrucomicrobium spinosum]
MQSHATTPTTHAMDYHIQVLHNGFEYCAYLTRGGTDDDYGILKFIAWAKRLKDAMQALSAKLEDCDQRWKPEIRISDMAGQQIAQDPAAAEYLRALSVPVILGSEVPPRVEVVTAAAEGQLLRLGQMDDEDYLRELCQLDQRDIDILLNVAGVRHGRGAWVSLRFACKRRAAREAAAKQIACAA